MNDTATAVKPPWHFWTIGLAGLLLFAVQAYDYVLAQQRDPAYMRNVPAEMGAYLDSFPAWSTALWAVSVWGSLLGAILLLMRRRHAAWAFAIALVCMTVSYAYHYAVGVPASLSTPVLNAIKGLILAIMAFYWWYSRRACKQGISK